MEDLPSSKLPPFTVSDYERDAIIHFIRHQLDYISRDDVVEKSQLKYLFPYLEEKQHIDANTVVYETEYVDRNYLEDYSEYYVRCFNEHPRMCSRIHFFSNSFTEADFRACLAGHAGKVPELVDGYIGYIVIRPIPKTFLARVCLKPYKTLFDDKELYKLLYRDNPVSLFGLELCVKTVALQEQDKVVSACATSALWVLFNAANHIPHDRLPSLSSITKSAMSQTKNGTRVFPNKGLDESQIADSLRVHGLEPLIKKFSIEASADLFDEQLSEIKQMLFAYLSNDIPVILGGIVYKLTDEEIKKSNSDEEAGGKTVEKEEVAKWLGRHLVCVLGYKKGGSVPQDGLSVPFAALKIDRIYAHDDRNGPYQKISMEELRRRVSDCVVDDEIADDVEDAEADADMDDATMDNDGQLPKESEYVSGLRINNYSGENELFVPEMMILGLYHKIRISYDEVQLLCDVFYSMFQMYEDDKEEREPLLEKAVKKLIDGEWSIDLTTNNKLKKELINDSSWMSLNGISDQDECLAIGMPKYIWRCKVSCKGNGMLDLLFDATEVPQGDVLIGYVSRNDQSDKVWQFLGEEVKGGIWNSRKHEDDLGDPQQNALSCFIRFFDKKSEEIWLNTVYGSAVLPTRRLKPGETDGHGNLTQRMNLHVIRDSSYGSGLLRELDQCTKYIWVIDIAGDLVLGEDVEDRGEYQGHPTLIDSKPARLGGELYFNPEGDHKECSGKWTINAESGAYSKRYNNRDVRVREILEQVVERKFKDAKEQIFINA